MKFLFLVCVILFEIVIVQGACPTIVTRSQWKSSRSLTMGKISLPVRRVFIHHTVTATCSSQSSCSAQVRGMQADHIKNNGWSDIGYSFLVGGDGRIYEGRGWDRVGAHTKGYNNDIGISFIGNFDKKSPPQIMLKAAQNLIKCGIERKKIRSDYGLYGHRDSFCTACPGQQLYNIIKKWPRYGKAGKVKKSC